MNKLSVICRSKKSGFSIARVTQNILPEISLFFNINLINSPSPKAGLMDLIKNFKYINKNVSEKLVWITGDVHYLLYTLRKKKVIVTVHDIMYYHYLHGLKRYLWRKLYIEPLKYATYVVFISEFAKEQVLDIIPLPSSTCFVIPNSIPNEYIENPKIFNSDKPRILHIGTMERKNLNRVANALSGISCHLRIIGSIDVNIMNLLKKNEIEYSVGINLSDSEMLQEYIHCDIVSFPSIFEGFGMPIIEGQAIGRSVITSQIEPMNSIAGGGATIVNPFSVEDIRSGFMRIINDEYYRKEKIHLGLRNVNNFKSKYVAEKYIDLFNKINQS